MKGKAKGSWKLDKIEIKFETGFSWREEEEEKHDRYIGKIGFTNGSGESFNLNIPSDMTKRYLEIMADDIVATAKTLGDKVAKSINDANQ